MADRRSGRERTFGWDFHFWNLLGALALPGVLWALLSRQRTELRELGRLAGADAADRKAASQSAAERLSQLEQEQARDMAALLRESVSASGSGSGSGSGSAESEGESGGKKGPGIDVVARSREIEERAALIAQARKDAAEAAASAAKLADKSQIAQRREANR